MERSGCHPDATNKTIRRCRGPGIPSWRDRMREATDAQRYINEQARPMRVFVADLAIVVAVATVETRLAHGAPP